MMLMILPGDVAVSNLIFSRASACGWHPWQWDKWNHQSPKGSHTLPKNTHISQYTHNIYIYIYTNLANYYLLLALRNCQWFESCLDCNLLTNRCMRTSYRSTQLMSLTKSPRNSALICTPLFRAERQTCGNFGMKPWWLWFASHISG